MKYIGYALAYGLMSILFYANIKIANAFVKDMENWFQKPHRKDDDFCGEE